LWFQAAELLRELAVEFRHEGLRSSARLFDSFKTASMPDTVNDYLGNEPLWPPDGRLLAIRGWSVTQ
jgi:hypothetical protein